MVKIILSEEDLSYFSDKTLGSLESELNGVFNKYGFVFDGHENDCGGDNSFTLFWYKEKK